MNNKRSPLADAMAFFDLQTEKPCADVQLSLDLACMTAAPPFVKTQSDLYECVSAFRRSISGQSNLSLVEKHSDLDSVGDGRTAIVMGLQHPPIDGGVRKLYLLGIRIVQIAYQGENLFGGGFDCPKTRLTHAGREFLREISDVGMILDLSHAGDQTAFDALDFMSEQDSPLQVMVSHTGIREVYEHPRNMSIDLLHQVSNFHEGLVGIYCLNFALSASDDSTRAFEQHILSGYSNLPDKLLGVGTDGIYRAIPEETLRSHFDRMLGMLNQSGAFNPRYPSEALSLNTPTKMRVLRNILTEAGYSEDFVDGICGGNLVNFLRRSIL